MMQVLLDVLKSIAQFVCQGTPERCFRVWGQPFPLCIRCTAVYAGILLMLVAIFALPRLRRRRIPSAACCAGYVGLALMGVMGSLAAFGGVDFPPWARLVVGALFGISIATLAKGRVAASVGIVESEGHAPRDLWTLSLAAGLVLAGIVTAPWLGNAAVTALAVVSAIGCLVSWACILISLVLWCFRALGGLLRKAMAQWT